MVQKKLIKVHPSDNVGVALVNLKAKEMLVFDGEEIQVLLGTKAKHKIALSKFNTGDEVVMYGVLVGKANRLIEKGEVLTTVNVVHQSKKVFKKTT